MIVLKILGLAALILVGMGALAGLGYLFTKAIQSADPILNKPVKPYNYKPEELWEAPSYWKNWEKN